MTVTKIKKREGSMKQQLCLKIRHRERETDKQRQRKREGVWQTDTDCYISSYDVKEYHRENKKKLITKNEQQSTKRELKLLSNGRFLRNMTWRLTTKEKNSKEGKKSKKT